MTAITLSSSQPLLSVGSKLSCLFNASTNTYYLHWRSMLYSNRNRLTNVQYHIVRPWARKLQCCYNIVHARGNHAHVKNIPTPTDNQGNYHLWQFIERDETDCLWKVSSRQLGKVDEGLDGYFRNQWFSFCAESRLEDFHQWSVGHLWKFISPCDFADAELMLAMAGAKLLLMILNESKGCLSKRMGVARKKSGRCL